MKVDESNFDILEKASSITRSDCEIKWADAENVDGYVEPYSMFCLIEGLLDEIDHLKETISDMKQDIEDNYRPIPYAEQVDVSEKDFLV